MGYFLAQVSWKYDEKFLLNPAGKQTNKQKQTGVKTTSLVEVMIHNLLTHHQLPVLENDAACFI